MKKQQQISEDEARLTMDLLDQQTRQEAGPWFIERTLARLQRKPEAATGSAGGFPWQWALTALLLILNSTALYLGLNTTNNPDAFDLSQSLDNEYELAPGELYDFTSNTYEDDFFQSN